MHLLPFCISWQLKKLFLSNKLGAVMVVKSVPITTNVVSLNTTHGEVFLIQHYVIKVVSDLRHVCDFLFSSTNKTDWHIITEILLKVALNTLIQYPISLFNRWIFFLLISLVANPCYCSLLVSLANQCIFFLSNKSNQPKKPLSCNKSGQPSETFLFQ